MATPDWQWDEKVQRGTDYADAAQVAVYDEQTAVLRDLPTEAEWILSSLELAPTDVLLEIGTGTGAFARAAAGRGHEVIALDVSPVMLDYAARRAREEAIGNISFVEAGFLTYEHRGEPVGAVVSQLALHHLPDAWKLLALRRIRGFMREGAKLFLSDVVFPDRAQADWEGYVREFMDATPAENKEEMATHLREEFSTFDWMMRQILERAGFAVEAAEWQGAFLGHYLCRAAPDATPQAGVPAKEV